MGERGGVGWDAGGEGGVSGGQFCDSSVSDLFERSIKSIFFPTYWFQTAV